jgi:hypothetical protein
MANEDTSTVRRTGVPVDSSGGPTVDPTKNVLDLVEAAVQRQDDLRLDLKARVDAEHVTLKEYIRDVLEAYDRRYEQRFDAAQKALDAALIAQRDAVKEAFTAQKEAVTAALASADRAVSKAEADAARRFQGVEEFRAQLGDQQRTLMPRVEAENRLATLSEKVGVLEGFRTEALSRGVGHTQGYGVAIGIISLVLTLLSVISVAIVLFNRMP